MASMAAAVSGAFKWHSILSYGLVIGGTYSWELGDKASHSIYGRKPRHLYEAATDSGSSCMSCRE